LWFDAALAAVVSTLFYTLARRAFRREGKGTRPPVLVVVIIVILVGNHRSLDEDHD